MLGKERTHDFTQANTQIVLPDQSAIQTQTFLSYFQSQRQRTSLNFQSPSINDLNRSQSNLVYGDPCSYRTNYSFSDLQQTPWNWSTHQNQVMPCSNQITSTTGQWTTASSPYNYEIVILPTNALKCYGYSRPFAEKYRSPPENVVVKHRDRRIRGFDKDGRVTFGVDFQSTYYHLNPEHISQKNPSFNNHVYIHNSLLNSLSSAQVLLLNDSNLILNRY